MLNNKRRLMLESTSERKSDSMRSFVIYYILTSSVLVVPETYTEILNEFNSFLHDNDLKAIPEPFCVLFYYALSSTTHYYLTPQLIEVNPEIKNQFIATILDYRIAYYYDESYSVWKMQRLD